MKRNDGGDERYLARLSFWYSTLVLLIAALCIICGTALFLAGITGNISLIARAPGGLRTDVTNAAPGVVFVIAGFLMIYVTRFRQHSPGRSNLPSWRGKPGDDGRATTEKGARETEQGAAVQR